MNVMFKMEIPSHCMSRYVSGYYDSFILYCSISLETTWERLTWYNFPNIFTHTFGRILRFLHLFSFAVPGRSSRESFYPHKPSHWTLLCLCRRLRDVLWSVIVTEWRIQLSHSGIRTLQPRCLQVNKCARSVNFFLFINVFVWETVS